MGEREEEVLHDLRERVKELTALHGCARILRDTAQPLEAVLGAIVALLPPAFQFPPDATASIRIGKLRVDSDGHRGSEWLLRSSAAPSPDGDGELVVAYHRELPFLREEVELLDSIAEMVRVELERRASISALEAERERLRLALSAADMGIWEWDLVANEVWWSGELARFVGSETALRGAFYTFAHHTHPEDRPRVLEALRAATRPDATSDRFEIEFRLVKPDGGARAVHAQGRVFRDARGAPARALAVISDVSRQRTLEAQLRQSQRLEAMGMIAGTVAHDFNNVLAVILTSGTLLGEQALADDSAELVRDIVEAAQRGRTLTRQLLAFGRKAPVRRARFDLAAVIRGVLPLLERLAKPCRITADAADGFVVYGDPSQLEQVLMNLVVNARDAMEHGGVVRIATAATELARVGAVEIRVSDSGSGMTPEVVARMYEPFFTTKEPGKGTGLGLAVVFGAVEDLQGKIQVETEVRVGTTFRIQLPVAV